MAVDLLSGCEQGSLDLTTKSPTAVLTSKFIKGLNSHINTSSRDYLRDQSFTSFIDDRSRSRHEHEHIGIVPLRYWCIITIKKCHNYDKSSLQNQR